MTSLQLTSYFGEKLTAFFLRSGTKKGCPILPLISTSTRSPSQNYQSGKGNKKHLNCKGVNLSQFAVDMIFVYRKLYFKHSTKKTNRTNKKNSVKLKGKKHQHKNLLHFLTLNSELSGRKI